MKRLLTIVLLVVIASGSARAVNPDEVLTDPALEARARAISLELRCLVCQNQSIDDSNSGLARDLRLIVRERLVAGDSDKDVRKYLTDRYGSFVLLNPPFNMGTAVLWLGPLLVLTVALAAFGFHAARRNGSAIEPAPLSVEEARVIDRLKELE